jgi:hypothetical protein
MSAVITHVWLGPHSVGDLLLRTRRDGLVDLKLWNGRLIRAGNVVLGGVLEVERHGGSFGR